MEKEFYELRRSEWRPVKERNNFTSLFPSVTREGASSHVICMFVFIVKELNSPIIHKLEPEVRFWSVDTEWHKRLSKGFRRKDFQKQEEVDSSESSATCCWCRCMQRLVSCFRLSISFCAVSSFLVTSLSSNLLSPDLRSLHQSGWEHTSTCRSCGARSSRM